MGPRLYYHSNVRPALAVVLIAVFASAACSNVIARKYEYEEEVFLSLDGSATVYVNASVPALVALRGARLPLDPAARLDRTAVRDLYATPVTRVASVTTSRREGRRYVHLRLDVDDIRRLGEAPPFAWSTYQFLEGDGTFEFSQRMGAAAGEPAGNAGWQGDELVAVRVHLPSRIVDNNSPAPVGRGNILVWEQPLSERQKGTPLEIQAMMEKESILFRTLALFGGMALLVALTFVGAIWFVKTRKACPKPQAPSPKSQVPSPQLDFRSISSRTSASVFSAFFTSNAPKPDASDLASIRSTLLCTTPSSVTRPRFTTTRIGGLTMLA